MITINLPDINLLDIGNTIQLAGAIYTGKGMVYLVPLPEESRVEIENAVEFNTFQLLDMNASEMEQFLKQTDLLDVQGPGKAILRKSQRQVDQTIVWRVYRRDEYRCRYCDTGEIPLTVDHIDLWENGGATVDENLVACCRRCNKLRGNMPYEEWLKSEKYAGVSRRLRHRVSEWNWQLVQMFPTLMNLRTKVRSR